MKIKKRKTKKLKLGISILIFALYVLPALPAGRCFAPVCFSQGAGELEFKLDLKAKTVPLPKVFRPNIDLGGRGFHHNKSWPQTMAAREVLEVWRKDIGFKGVYRIQYNLWEISQFDREKDGRRALLDSYQEVIRDINASGGIVILNLFGTPAGSGRVLDRKSPPRNLKEFKASVKQLIRELSCQKRLNIWYEVWTAPDLDDFFLGGQQDYFNLYQAVAESIEELESETRIQIPVGGPSASWWFQNFDGNTIATPERSLIYELIQFCYRKRLPLDFITWHGFSSDPRLEDEETIYKKNPLRLIRDWLSYFNFSPNTPLIIDEWNYDQNANVLPQRAQDAFVTASYIPARLQNMQRAGLDYQFYFSLEDFQANKEGVVRNVGVFSFDPEYSGYKGSPKNIYSVMIMLNSLGEEFIPVSAEDEFAGLIAAKNGDKLITLLVYNYIDPRIAIDYISRKILSLNAAERNALLKVIRSGGLEKLLKGGLDIPGLRLNKKASGLLEKAWQLDAQASVCKSIPRAVKLKISNLEGHYFYKRYTAGSSCVLNCKFVPAQEIELDVDGSYQEVLMLEPYSVHFITLEKALRQNEEKPIEKSKPEEEPVPQLKEGA